MKADRKHPIVKGIIHDVAKYYGISENNLVYGNRERRYSEPRHIACYCLYCIANISYPSITDIFNKRSHESIIYAVKKVCDWVDNPILNSKAVECIKLIQGNMKNYGEQSEK